MNPSRRRFTTLMAAMTGSSVMPAAAQPVGSSAPARIIAGFPPGGTIDTVSRRLADAWRAKTGKTFIVDNRPGAAGRVAIERMKREPADGSAILCSPGAMMTIYPHVYKRLSYDPAIDVIPVSPICVFGAAFAVSSMVPASVISLDQFVAWAKANPNVAAYASPAAGSMLHFLGDKFQRAAGLKLTHVPYKGSAPAMQDIIGGQIPSIMSLLGDFLPYAGDGRVRVIAVSGEKRSRFMPGVPTFAEQGFRDIVGSDTFGLFLPARTPPAIVEQYAGLASAALGDGGVRAGLELIGMEPVSSDAESYRKLLAAEREAWKPVVLASGFSADE